MVYVPMIARGIGKNCEGGGWHKGRLAQRRLVWSTPLSQLDSRVDTFILAGRAAPGLYGLRPDFLSV